jgi:hypothetical protein
VAAPAWGQIAAETLRQLDVHPESVKEQAVRVSSAAPPSPPLALAAAEAPSGGAQASGAVVPDLTGLPARSAIRRLAESQLEPELRGSGRAVAQHPRAGSVVRRGARVRVTLAPPG